MTCYIVPAVAAAVHYVLRKNIPTWKKNENHLWLNFLFLGGGIFGVVDHLWNKELFLIGENLISDLMLGVTITLVLLSVWAIVVVLNKVKVKESLTVSD